MLDWDKLRIFHVVATAGSFTEAAARLNCSQSSISRQIRTLEESLNVSLFTRHARGLVLTQEGQQLLQTTHDVTANIESTERTLRESKAQPFGELKVTTMVTFGAVWLTPHLKEFIELYPDINIKLILADEDLDLSAGEADVAIRLHDPSQADLIQRPLATFHNHIYASPEYLDRMGVPQTPEDLEHHEIVSFGSGIPHAMKNLNWLAESSKKKAGNNVVLEVNNMYGLLHAVEAGIGLAALPDYLVHNRGNLVRLLSDSESASFPSYFCYPPELRGSKRIAVFRDFMVDQLRAASNIL